MNPGKAESRVVTRKSRDAACFCLQLVVQASTVTYIHCIKADVNVKL